MILKRYCATIGYSEHGTGLATSLAAVALGARYIERHFTLDRAQHGTDHAASIEPEGLRRLIRDVKTITTALGSGRKYIALPADKILNNDDYFKYNIMK